MVVENTTAARGTPVFGAGTPIRRTPLSSFGTPTTIARPAPAPARVGDSGATKPTATAAGSVTGSFGTKGIVATAKPVTPSGEGKPRKIILQENENDFEFLKKIGDEIGYVLTESPLGNALYFGAGLEVGNRQQHLLVAGDYVVGGRTIPANVASYSSLKSVYGIPAEIVVTGFEDGKRFSLVVTPEDLAARHKTTTETTSNLPPAAQPPNTNVTGSYATKGIKATAKPIDQPAAPKTKSRTAFAGAANYASSKVKTLLTGAYPTANRRVLGGVSSRQDALEKGLEALALTQLAFQQVDVSVFGIPTIQRGDEVVLEGSLLPKNMRGLYLVRTIGGDVDSGNGYSMKLTLNRNTIG